MLQTFHTVTSISLFKLKKILFSIWITTYFKNTIKIVKNCYNKDVSICIFSGGRTVNKRRGLQKFTYISTHSSSNIMIKNNKRMA